jgi:hypothetical protein
MFFFHPIIFFHHDFYSTSWQYFLNQSNYRLQVALWDANSPRSDTLIGSCLFSLDALLSTPAGVSVGLSESPLGSVKDATDATDATT